MGSLHPLLRSCPAPWFTTPPRPAGFVSFEEFVSGMVLTVLLFHVDNHETTDSELAELMVRRRLSRPPSPPPHTQTFPPVSTSIHRMCALWVVEATTARHVGCVGRRG